MRLNINLIETSPVHNLCRGSSESHGNKRHYHYHPLIHKHWEISQHWCDTVLILSVSLESSPLFKEPLATIRNCNLAFKDIVCTPPPPLPSFLLEGGGGLNVKPPIRFSKGGIHRTSVFRGGLLGKRGWLFSGGLQFLHKKQTKI